MNLYRLISNAHGDWRGYGRSRIRRQAAENAGKSREEILALQEALLKKRVADAVARFPAYARKVGDRAEGPFEQLPIWTRQDQRALFATLKEPPVPGAFVHATGGSTGEPTRFYVTRESYEWRTAVSDRGYSWAGAEEGQRCYFVWSTPVYPPSFVQTIRQGASRWLSNRRFFSLFRFGPEDMRECCLDLSRFRPKALVSYSGNLLELALFVREHPDALRCFPETIVGAAEGLPSGGRVTIEKHLHGELFMSYGTREFMLIGMECSQHAGYHISADNLRVEVVDEAGKPCPAGESGRILVTDLRNDANPFIRYEVGDVGAMESSPCDCGNPFPRLARVEGRCGEYLELPNGAQLTAIFIAHTFKEFPWIERYQILQQDRTAITVQLVTHEALPTDGLLQLERLMRDKMGSAIAIEFRRVTELQKNASGKTPVVVKMSGSSRPLVDATWQE
jgi:phenylacetate-CoA ligase